MMGDIFGDGDEDERPVHEVALDGFYIGKYPVTQGQWEKVIGEMTISEDDSISKHLEEMLNELNGKDKIEYNLTPVINVSWEDAQRFLKKLNTMSKRKYEFRLPTEAEWEYAARSGGRRERYAGGNDIEKVAWSCIQSMELSSFGHESLGPLPVFYGGQAQPVGTKHPNGLGIFDMSGNVKEWCQDWYCAYSSETQNNPKGPSSGSERILRGGSWRCFFGDNKRLCRTVCRLLAGPQRKQDDIGFRVAKSLR